MKTIHTRVAHAGVGEHMFFGHQVLSDLLGKETLTGLLAMAILGRRVTVEERDLLDGLTGSVTAADPRIWPLKVSRMLASRGEMLAGFAAGQLAMMGTYISPRIIGHAAEHLGRLRIALDGKSGEDLERALRDHVDANPRLAGYGVPLREQDERLQALRRFMGRSGRAALPNWRAQAALSEHLLREKGLAANVGIGLAAALLDMDCTPTQAGALSTLLHQHDFAANAFEAAQQCSEEMQRLPDECVSYIGPSPRISPRAAAADRAQPRVGLDKPDSATP
jgi:hypothetical protein